MEASHYNSSCTGWPAGKMFITYYSYLSDFVNMQSVMPAKVLELSILIKWLKTIFLANLVGLVAIVTYNSDFK